jgi:hypothetical protein
VAARKLPMEDQVLELLGDGLGDKEVAEKVGTTRTTCGRSASLAAFGQSRPPS